MERNRSHIVNAFARFLIQCLDVTKCMREAQSRHPNLAGCQPIEHERIVGIRAVRDGNFPHLRRLAASGIFCFCRNYRHFHSKLLTDFPLIAVRPENAATALQFRKPSSA